MDTTVELKRRRFTLEEYHRMGEVGIFREKERVELLSIQAFADVTFTGRELLG